MKTSLAQRERQALILTNQPPALRMAWAMLRRWRRHHLCRKEVESVVGISLCEAAAKYNRECGSFLTLLHYYLRGNLIKEFVSEGGNRLLSTSDELVETLLNTRSIAPSARSAQTSSRKALAVLLSSEIEHGLPSLEPEEREVFQRAFIAGETIDEISAALGASRSHIGRVRQSAVNRLEALYGV